MGRSGHPGRCRSGWLLQWRVPRSHDGPLGGRTGIRTLERVAPLTVFKTVAFVRSATLPAMKGTERAPSGAADRCRKAVAPVSRGDEGEVSSLLDLGRLTRRHETVHAALPPGHLTR